MANNQSLQAARAARKDEFYTQLSDIEQELQHYKDHFRNKVVYCNCDDPRVSNFFHYFSFNFEKLGLKKLVTTCYKNQTTDLFSKHDSEQAIYLEYNGDKNLNRVPDLEEINIHKLHGDGDFRSDECIELLKQADIICTNPPFSLFREYVAQLVGYEKKFLIIGSKNAASNKEIFPLIQDNKLWLGYSKGDLEFQVPDHYPPKEHRYRMDENGKKFYSLGNAGWFTNLDIEKRHENLILYKTYSEKEYPYYDNYNAISVERVSLIPKNWRGAMGVPFAFLDKHNPNQFEIIGADYQVKQGLLPEIINPAWEGKIDRGYINGKRKFARLLIKNRNPE